MVTTATTTMASGDAIRTDNDDDDDYCSRNLNPSIVEKLEAGAFRELCRHLQERSDSVQNMDLMALSGFCRNCLAKWMVLEARRMVDKQSSACAADNDAATPASSITERLDALTIQALNAMGYEEAARHVYGMTYNDYKARHQKKATDEQMERYNASSHLHAQHDKALLDTRAADKPESSTTTTTAAPAPAPAITPSSVCCENVEQVAAAAAAAARHDKTTAASPSMAKGSRTLPSYQPAPIPTKLLFNSMETRPLCIGVLTVSDRAHRNEYVTGDVSGPAVVHEIQKLFNHAAQQQQQSSTSSPVFVTSIVPDEVDAIQQQIKAWCGGGSSTNNNNVDLIFTTGGTGFSRRDVTPEATRPLLHQECGGLMAFCATECSKIQPLASLSRGTAGIILQQPNPNQQEEESAAAAATTTTMIANLPGNPQAISEIMPLLLPLLLHALCDLRGIVAHP